ncbi:Bifunctional F420 biosynthesis protein FbiB [Paraconexibacter sp. AEG42_29]|uniref:Bifunctional F420 biosynthesis protein FbiB n=1 Tax=Paraconexibacter sp. AEG42_29 TaxID=2997339 RepID=A0AAU7ATH3_9ACTN
MAITATAVAGLPEVTAGADLAALIAARVTPSGQDVVVVAHKVVSKAEGAVVALSGVRPGDRARAIAARQGRDPRQVQVILDQTAELVRVTDHVLICRTHHGFVCANAGVDASNAAGDDELIVLPVDPDHSARRLRAGLPGTPAVVITDSFGRAWRNGQVDVAIGVAGLAPLEDWRGLTDSVGRPLQATWIAVADQAAAAADLARTKDSRDPVVLVEGLGRWVTAADGPGVQPLLRPPSEDLFL